MLGWILTKYCRNHFYLKKNYVCLNEIPAPVGDFGAEPLNTVSINPMFLVRLSTWMIRVLVRLTTWVRFLVLFFFSFF